MVTQTFLLLQCGQTLGKLVFGIKIVRKDGGAASFAQLLRRGVVGTMAYGMVPGFLFMDFLTVAGHGNQGAPFAHDKVARTRVVEV